MNQPPEASAHNPGHNPILVYDGGCPFCRHFAELCALRSGIPGFQICDGRRDDALRHQLAQQGFSLADGAMLLVDNQVLHGSDAVSWVCSQMTTSHTVLHLLRGLMLKRQRAKLIYPVLLAARRAALAWKGMPVDPDRC